MFNRPYQGWMPIKIGEYITQTKDVVNLAYTSIIKMIECLEDNKDFTIKFNSNSCKYKIISTNQSTSIILNDNNYIKTHITKNQLAKEILNDISTYRNELFHEKDSNDINNLIYKLKSLV